MPATINGNTQDKHLHNKNASNYSINLATVLGSHQLGASYVCMGRFFYGLGMKSLSQGQFKTCEKKVGPVLMKVAEDSMKLARLEEIELTRLATDKTFFSPTYGTLPALVAAIDMAWNKRSSGRRYDSNSGFSHFIGARSKKILDYELLIKSCLSCTRIEHFEKLTQIEKAKLLANQPSTSEANCRVRANIAKYKKRLKSLEKHDYVKNYFGNTSKGMESEATVRMVCFDGR